MDPREAERFEEGLDSEYHDATESPHDSEKPDQGHVTCSSHGVYGSSSLRECLDLLNQAKSNSPATLHCGVKTDKSSNPLHFLQNGRGRSIICTNHILVHVFDVFCYFAPFLV